MFSFIGNLEDELLVCAIYGKGCHLLGDWEEILMLIKETNWWKIVIDKKDK